MSLPVGRAVVAPRSKGRSFCPKRPSLRARVQGRGIVERIRGIHHAPACAASALKPLGRRSTTVPLPAVAYSRGRNRSPPGLLAYKATEYLADGLVCDLKEARLRRVPALAVLRRGRIQEPITTA